MIARADWVDHDLAAQYNLTPRQIDILAGLAKGMTRGEIGRALYLSEDTICTHSVALYRRLGVSGHVGATGGTAAVAVAYDIGILRTLAVRIERARAAGLRVVA